MAGIVSSQSASIPEVRLAEIAVEKSESLFRLSKFDALPRFAVGAEYVDVQSSSISPAMTGRDALSLKFSSAPDWKKRQNSSEGSGSTVDTQGRGPQSG